MELKAPTIKIVGPSEVKKTASYTVKIDGFPQDNCIVSWSISHPTKANTVEELERVDLAWYNPSAEFTGYELGKVYLTATIKYHLQSKETGEYELLGIKKARKQINVVEVEDPDNPSPIVTRSARATTRSIVFNKGQINKKFDISKKKLKTLLINKYGKQRGNKLFTKYSKKIKNSLNQSCETWNKYIVLGESQKSFLPATYTGQKCYKITYFYDPNSATIAYCGGGNRGYFGFSSGGPEKYTGFYNDKFELGFNLYQIIEEGGGSILTSITTHELAHALGLVIPYSDGNGSTWFGTTTDGQVYNILNGNEYITTQKSYKRLTDGIIKYDSLALIDRLYPPLEDIGGAGTGSVHWERDARTIIIDTFNAIYVAGIQNELMIGFAGKNMKLSELSLAFLVDSGFKVKNTSARTGLYINYQRGLFGEQRTVTANHYTNKNFLTKSKYRSMKSTGLPKFDFGDLNDPEISKKRSIAIFEFLTTGKVNTEDSLTTNTTKKITGEFN